MCKSVKGTMFYSLRKLFVFGIGMTFPLLGKAQSTPEFNQGEYKYVPPSPTQAELGKYGLVPVNMSTGAMNTSIPLYSLKTTNLEIPVSLSYLSTGVKVDQIASNVGMNWSLNAGGVITRIIRGKADEMDNSETPYPANVSSINHDLVKYLDAAASNPDFDTERDLYTFNFMGNTGSFVFSRENEPVFSTQRNLQVFRSVESGHSVFVIGDEKGVLYYFELAETSRMISLGSNCSRNYDGYQETSWFLTKIVHPLGDVINLDYDSYSITYSVGVSQSFTERTSGVSSCPSLPNSLCQSQITSSTQQLKRIRTNGFGDLEFYFANNRTDIPGDYKLDSITYLPTPTQVLNRWKFTYIFSNNTSFGNSAIIAGDIDHRMFLQSVSFEGNNSAAAQKYSFEYDDINGLPKRLSFAQDHWGYFNGQSNQDFVPKMTDIVLGLYNQPLFENKGGNREPNFSFAKKGTLKKIIYPTKGFSEIEYAGNTYYGQKKVYPNKQPYSVGVTSNGTGTTSNNVVVPSAEGQMVAVLFNVTSALGDQADLIHSKGSLSIIEVESGVVIESGISLKAGESQNKYYYLQAGKSYRFTVSASWDQVTSTATFSLYNQAAQLVNDNILTGGLRVAKVSSYSSATALPEITNYLYAAYQTPAQSSGVLAAHVPVYLQSSVIHNPIPTTEEPTYNCVFDECYYYTLQSNSLVNLNGFSGNAIAYKYVVLSKGSQYENGYEEHEFMIDQDGAGRIVYGENIMQAPFTNFSWSNGLEVKTSTYKKSGTLYVLKHQVENNYVKDERINNAVPSMIVRKKWDRLCSNSTIEYCNETTINQKTMIYTCITDHTHIWGGYNSFYRYIFGKAGITAQGFRTGGTMCWAPGNNNVLLLVLYHPCFGKAVGDTVIVRSQLDNIDAIEYNNLSHWFYLKSSTEKNVMDNGDVLTITKNYEYLKPAHLQLTSLKTARGDGKIITSKYWYPEDFNSVDTIYNLKDLFSSLPIKTETYNNEKLISGTVNTYYQDGFPSQVWKWERETPIDSSSYSAPVLIGTDYKLDNWLVKDGTNKRPREIRRKGGEIVTLIWGYGRKYLIGQITNKSLAEVQTALGGAGALSNLENSSDETFINTSMTTLRNNLSTSLVESFTYYPGIGLKSQTDAKGKTTSYEYDDLKRLKVINQDGNIVKTFDYNFSNNQ